MSEIENNVARMPCNVSEKIKCIIVKGSLDVTVFLFLISYIKHLNHNPKS